MEPMPVESSNWNVPLLLIVVLALLGGLAFFFAVPT